MTERPILFAGAMVRALPPGPKTQTRRELRVQPPSDVRDFLRYHHPKPGAWWWGWDDKDKSIMDWCVRCPYGEPGDRLRVRETFWAFGRWVLAYDAKKNRDAWTFIDMTSMTSAGYRFEQPTSDGVIGKNRKQSTLLPCWWKRPAIFMPRAASRILLEVTEVRIQRLQDISEADALAEGIQAMRCSDCHLAAYGLPGWGHDELNPTAKGAYRYLWESINGAGTWDQNDWVWAVSFKRITP